MKIFPIMNSIKPNFTSTRRTEYYVVKDGVCSNDTFVKQTYEPKNHKIKNSNTTCFFREDIDTSLIPSWTRFIMNLLKYLPDEKINVYDFACSDGTEAYSLIISLIERLGEEKAKRFFPIKAYDMDGEILKLANSGLIQANDEDIDRINSYTDNNLEKYFKIIDNRNNCYVLLAKPILKDNVVFKQAKIQDEAKNLNKPNSLIFARNMWRYLPYNDRENTFRTLNEVMDDSSVLFFGDYDLEKDNSIPSYMIDNGYKKCSELGNALTKA